MIKYLSNSKEDYEEWLKLSRELDKYHDDLGGFQCNTEDSFEDYEKYVSGKTDDETNHVLGIVDDNNDTFIGTSHIRIARMGLDIMTLIIKEEYRNKGYGSLLINEIKKIAKENNINDLFVFVDYRNTKSIKFYKKHGLIPEVLMLKGAI